MKSLKISLILILSIFIFQFSSGQETRSAKEKMIDQQVEPETQKELIQSFKQMFEDRNVGNLHIHLKKIETKATPESSPKIDRAYFGLFQDLTGDYADNLDNDPRAVFAIDGINKEFYIIELDDDDGFRKISLFEMAAGELVEKAILAQFNCDMYFCNQTESWIQDVNGDVKLDLIIKNRRLTKLGRSLSTDTKVYYLERNKDFRKEENPSINEGDYRLKDLSFYQ